MNPKYPTDVYLIARAVDPTEFLSVQRSTSSQSPSEVFVEGVEMPAKVFRSHDGKAGFLGTIGVSFMIDKMESGGELSLIEHPMSPHALAAPLHRHSREDEYASIPTLTARFGLRFPGQPISKAATPARG